MKILFILLLACTITISCKREIDKEKVKAEIRQAEKDFETMVSEKGTTEAFYCFASQDAVIHRENDSLIQGRENIKQYYEKKNRINSVLQWTPDFIEVSDCGTLGYTYGKYVLTIKTDDGKSVTYKGVFHTVWKKQKDESWKFVWD